MVEHLCIRPMNVRRQDSRHNFSHESVDNPDRNPATQTTSIRSGTTPKLGLFNRFGCCLGAPGLDFETWDSFVRSMNPKFSNRRTTLFPYTNASSSGSR